MLLIDTHVVLWWRAGSDRLSPRARRSIESADRVGISPISALEIGMLVEKGRVQLDRPVIHWIDDLFREQQVGTAELSPLVAAQAASLSEFHGDPADRIIYATALLSGSHLVTKDARIRTYAAATGAVSTIW